MNVQITSVQMMDTLVAAAVGYGDIVVDHDPDDGDHVVPGELRRFLARLRLLHGVPFSYLVPDADLLPLESIRFFHLDRTWTDALVQGALSVGTVSTADRTQLEEVYGHIRDEVDETERTIREPNGEDRLAAPGGEITGFLMRSRAVSGWPNLHVRAYSRDVLPDDALSTVAESDPSRMKVLRMERLAPAVLLVLFDGMPSVVHIEEPRQGIQFGVRTDQDNPRVLELPLRDNATGENDETVDPVKVPFRPNAPGVINIGALRTRVETALTKPAPAAPEVLDPNEFALQALRFPYRQVFGDPDDLESLKFFEVENFRIQVGLEDWATKIDHALVEVDR